MKLLFSAGRVDLEPEDVIDTDFVYDPITPLFISDVNLEMRAPCGPPCAKLSNYEAKTKILKQYRDWLKEKAWELRNK